MPDLQENSDHTSCSICANNSSYCKFEIIGAPNLELGEGGNDDFYVRVKINALTSGNICFYCLQARLKDLWTEENLSGLHVDLSIVCGEYREDKVFGQEIGEYCPVCEQEKVYEPEYGYGFGWQPLCTQGEVELAIPLEVLESANICVCDVVVNLCTVCGYSNCICDDD